MAKQKTFLLYPILIFVFLIALVSGNWSITYADKMDASPFPSPQTRPPSTPAGPPVIPTFPPPPICNLCSPANESVSQTVE